MISNVSGFKLYDRGFDDTVLLIPGWATDARIFAPLDLAFNYLIPDKTVLSDLEKNFLHAVSERQLGKISMIGWSMGAFIVRDIASKYPDKIGGITFISARRKYEERVIKKIRVYLKKDRTTYLQKFYEELFSEGDIEAASWFRQNLLKNYLEELDLGTLLEGLDYLSRAELRPEGLKGMNIRFIHGTRDTIAPIEEALSIKENLPDAEFIEIKGAGHAPFLDPNFKNIFEAPDE